MMFLDQLGHIRHKISNKNSWKQISLLLGDVSHSILSRDKTLDFSFFFFFPKCWIYSIIDMKIFFLNQMKNQCFNFLTALR